MSIQFLTLAQVKILHDAQIELFGGGFGVREEGLLLSAIEMPQQGFGDEYFHAFPFEMAAAYLFHIAKNHPFVDGNKRTAVSTALVFLEINSVSLTATDTELEQLAIAVATDQLDKTAIATFFATHS